MSEETTVPLGLLRRYLAFHGWREAERPSGQVIVGTSYADTFFRERASGRRNVDIYLLTEPGLDDVELAVPRAVETSESRRRLSDVIETLSQLEGRDRVQVITDVRSIGFDIVTSRVPDDQVVEDTIHLDQAVSYTANIKRLLAAGATTERAPDVFYMRVSKEGSKYAENCRFGHTFRSSFGFTIESPLAPNIAPVFPGMEQQPPFERRVIHRIAQGITAIRECVAAEDPGLVVRGFQTGFSANMCEEFADLVQQTAPSGMGFGFLLSPEWPAPPIGELWVGPSHVEMSQLAAKRMREQAPIQPLEIFGRITRLQNEADPQDLLDQTHDREIVINWKSDEFGGMNVRLVLGPADYLTAVQAHLRGHIARATGRLEKRGRFWWLAEMTAFSA